MERYLEDTEALQAVFEMMKKGFGDYYDRAFIIFGHYLKCRKTYAWSVVEVFVHGFKQEIPLETIEKIITRLEQHWEAKLKGKVAMSPSDEIATQRMFFGIYRDLLHQKPTVNMD